MYQAPVRARAGEWADVRLPLASFVLTDRGLVYGSRVTPCRHAHAKRLWRRKKTDARGSLWRTKRSSLAAWTMRGHGHAKQRK